VSGAVTTDLPGPLAQLVADFADLPAWERLGLLLELADELPEVPERYAGHRDRLEQVQECQSPVFLAVEVGADRGPGRDSDGGRGRDSDGGRGRDSPSRPDSDRAEDRLVRLVFDAPREAPTTRGFAGLLHAGLDGQSAGVVLAVPDDFPARLGLTDLVSPLRMRGLSAMLSRIKRQVREQLASTS